jgi:hypothetical protein
VIDKDEQVVQNLQYNITTRKSDLPCDTNVMINATFSVDFFDIDPYEEVLVSCGLTVIGSFKVDDSVAVLTQCEFHKHNNNYCYLFSRLTTLISYFRQTNCFKSAN